MTIESPGSTVAGRRGVDLVTIDVGGELMTRAPGPVVTRRRLGGELRRLRESAGLRLDDVARALECSTSKVSRLENGKGIPRARDVREMLDAFGVTDTEVRSRLEEWARTGQQPMWWSAYADVLPPGFDTYVELEWDAARICAYEAHLVHGLLQTVDYARAVLEGVWAWGSRTAEHLDRVLEVRRKRQHVLSAEHGLTFRCVLDESALHRVVGSPAVMHRQIDHLVEVAEAGHIEVRILPFTAGPVGAFVESFAKLEFSEGLEHGVVHVERPDSSAVFESDTDVLAAYEKRMAALLRAALPEERSVPLMKQVAYEFTHRH